jgi:N-acetylmuramoyl-L-alanine amidase
MESGWIFYMHRRKRGRIVIWIRYPKGWRLLLACCALGVLASIIAAEIRSERTWSEWALPLSGKVIVLDPGHGGEDGGAVSKDGLVEKDVTLTISLLLRDYLQQAGAIVYMTRETDKDLADPDNRRNRKRQDLTRRAEYVQSKSPDLLLTIHLNSIDSPRWRGAQTFYYPNHPDNELLAKLIQDSLIQGLANTTRQAKLTPHEVYLLKTAKMPAALVEVGFLSNPEEAKLLADDLYQRKVAAAIYEGVLRYMSGERLGTEEHN